uniref:RRM domain-containing protein n=1 Tax=Parastrongyloides trichosuri TaxID=131310 RepID=A0A0N4ZF33_PARTI
MANHFNSEKKIPDQPPFKVYIGNLPYDAIQADLDDIFDGCKMKDTKMVHDKETGNFKGYAYVEFESREDLIKALKLDKASFEDRPLRIDIANSNPRDGGNMQKRGGSYGQRGASNSNSNGNFRQDSNRRGNGFHNRGNQQERNERIQNGRWVTAHPPNRRRGNSGRDHYKPVVEAVDDAERPKIKLQPRTTDPEELAKIKLQQEEEEAARLAKIFGKSTTINKE